MFHNKKGKHKDINDLNERDGIRASRDEDALESEETALPVSRGKQVLLVILPLIAVALIAVLILLIINMPQGKDIQLAKLSLPTERLAATVSASKEEPLPIPTDISVVRVTVPASKLMSRDVLSQLIRTGAGIPPGMQSSPPDIVDEPPQTVWTPPTDARTTAVIQESQRLPALADFTKVTIPQASLLVQETAEPSAQVTALPSGEAQVIELPLEIPTESVIPLEPLLPLEYSTETVAPGGFYPTQVDAYVYGDVVNVRANSDMNAEILTQVHAGDVLYEIATNGSWSHVILANGTDGYIYSNLLTYNYVAPQIEEAPMDIVIYPASEFEPYHGRLYSLFSGVNIRSTPSTEGDVLGTMFYGDWCEAIAYTGGWFQIQWYDGEAAYVHGDYLTADVIAEEELSGEIVHEEVQYITADIPPTPTPADLAGGSAVVSVAMQYVGYPYVYGTAGPNSFDCSGFAQYVYSQMGVSLGRSTYDQVYAGIPVSFGYKDYTNMVAGDLVLFAEGSNVYHVGIYIGGGQMVHAGNSSTGVVIDDLNLDFWAARVSHVRRIFY